MCGVCMSPGKRFLGRFDQTNVLCVTQWRLPDLEFRLRRIRVAPIDLVRLGSQMREHMMSDPGLAFVTQRGNVDGGGDDPLAGSWRRIG